MSENFEHRPQPLGEQPAEPEGKPEQELSPEMIEKIMEKVQDIDEQGTAYTVIGAYWDYGFDGVVRWNRLEGKLRSILREGLIPSHGADPEKATTQKRISDWSLFSYLNHFMIVGRSLHRQNEFRPQVNESPYLGSPGLVLIFDPSFMTEMDYSNRKAQSLSRGYGESITGIGINVDNLGYGEYCADGGYAKGTKEYRELRKSLKDKSIVRPTVSEGRGFVTDTRVPPRRFRGLILSCEGGNTSDSDTKVGTLRNIMIAAATETNTERLLPIYDTHGNLLWPKQMSYEEVKQFVAQHERRKSEVNEPHETDKSSPE